MTINLTGPQAPVTDEELDQMIWKLERDGGMTPKMLSLMRELREVRRAYLMQFTKAQRDILIKTAEYMANRENTSDYSENIRKVAEIALAALQSFGNPEQLEPVSNRDELNSPASPDGWIPVSERMPEREVDVQLYCADSGEQMVGYIERNEGEGLFRFASLPHGGGVYCKPTHWKPLSAAPKEVG